MRRLIRLLVWLTVSAASFAQNTSAISVVLDADPARLDPFYSTAWVEEQILHNVFDKLFEVDENMNILPGLVQEYTVSEDGLLYIFHIRDDVWFHDGTKLDADAVKYNLDRILGARDVSPRYFEISMIDTVSVINEYSIEVTVHEPATPLIGALANRAGMIASPTQIELLGSDHFMDHPVGSGPFEFDSRVRGVSITLKRNDSYWQDGLPHASGVEYRIISDENVAVLNLQSGQVDMLQARSIPDQILPVLERDARVVLDLQGGIGWQGLWLNMESEPFSNKWLRKAVDVAIDRAVLAAVAYNNAAEPAWSPYSPRTPYHDGVIVQRDLDLVQEYLEKAGHADGFSFTLNIGVGGAYQRAAEMIMEFLQEAGITVRIQVMEYNQVLSNLYDGNYQATLAGWNGRVDPDGDIYSFHYTGGANNYSGYSNPELDEILDRSRSLRNGPERAASIQEAVEIVREDTSYVYLVHQAQRHAYSTKLSGVTVHPDGMVRLLHVIKEQ